MESYADKIKFMDPEWDDRLESIYSYAKALEFALECVGRGVRMPTDTPLGKESLLQQMADNERRSGDTLEVVETSKVPIYTEQKQLDTEHFFKEYGPENPCGKPLCSVCCPGAPKETNP